MYRDSDLERLEKEKNRSSSNEPRMYCGAEIDEGAKSLLSKDPNFMLLNHINKTEIEVEIEKGIVKARYELMSCDGGDEEEDDVENSEGRYTKVAADNTLNYAAMRATEIPTVARLCPPRPSNLKKEKVLDNVKNKLLEVVSDYQKEQKRKPSRTQKREYKDRK